MGKEISSILVLNPTGANANPQRKFAVRGGRRRGFDHRRTLRLAMALAMMAAACAVGARAQVPPNPVPLINQPLVPDTAAPGGASFTLTVNGTGFASGAVVYWNGAQLITNVVSSSQVTATVPAANIASAGTASVTVVNPASGGGGGGTSNVVYFTVIAPSSFPNFVAATGSPITVGTTPDAVAVGDFNGDGKADLAVPNRQSDTVTVLLGGGDGTFTQATGSPINAGSQPADIVAADFNGDGKLDLAVANFNVGTVTILLGNGNGTFTQATGSPIPAATLGDFEVDTIAVGDFNRDGKLDLAIGGINAAPSTADLAIMLGQGDGTFLPAVGSPMTSGTGIRAIAVGDLNNDGALDLALVNQSDNTVSILLGNGTGTFTQASGSPITVGAGPDAIAAGDFNGDGNLDLAAANSTDGTVSILLGNGGGAFTPASGSPVTVGSLPPSVTAGDFNGDGKLDLAVGNASGYALSLLMGNGDGTFSVQNELYEGLLTTERTLATGDLNGDGRMDLAMADANNSTVSALLQQTPAPVATLSTTSLGFPNQVLNTTSTAQSVQVTNSGNASLNFTSIAASGDFAVAASGTTCVVGTPVAIAGSCTINVTFTPTATGSQTGTLTIADDAAGTPQLVSLSGTGASAAVVSLSASSLTFGNQAVGSTSAAQNVTLMNTGTGPLGIASIYTTDPSFAETNNCPASVAPTGTCTISVTFSPSLATSYSGSLVITDDALGSPHMVGVSGTGFSLLTPSYLTFSDQGVGTTSGPLTVTVTNSTGATLAISGASISGTNPGDFAATNNCPSSLAAAATCTVSVTFTPSAYGNRDANLDVNTGIGAASISVNGWGYISKLTPSVLSFVAQTVGTSSPVQNVTLVNVGSSPLTISNIYMTDTTDFSQSNNCSNTVPANGTCTFSFIFTPSVAGPIAGTFYVTTDAPEGQISMSLAGTGRTVSASPDGLLFDNQGVGTTSAPQTVTFTNYGSSAITISSITTTDPVFAQTNTCGSSLAAGAGCTISVTFTPAAAVAYVDLAVGFEGLVINSSAPEGTQYVSLMGVGETITQSARLLFFGQQGVGTTSAAQAVTLSNPGATAVDVSQVVAAGDFAQTNNCGTSLVAGGSCTVSVTFTPTVAGPRSGAVTITSAAAGTLTVSLFGNSPIVNLPGFRTNVVWPNDDDSTLEVPLPFTANFFGNQYNGLFVNNNGNVTFDTQLFTYTPFNLTNTGTVIVAPFFADVDTSAWPTNNSQLVTYGTDTVNGHTSFGVNYFNVGYCCGETNKLDTFQVLLIDRSDVGAGDFDIEFNYGKIQWETGDASRGTNGLGGYSARAGYSNGTGLPGTSLELPGSAINGGLLDSNATTGLINNRVNSTLSGQYVFEVRAGNVVPPGLALSTASLAFPSTAVGQTSSPLTVTLSNTGGSSITLSSIAASGDFAQTNNCGSALQPGMNCTVNVTFTPTVAGSRTGSLTITDSAPGSPQTVSLTGTGTSGGTPALTLSASTLTMPDTPLNLTCTPRTLTLTNSGSGPLTISSILTSPSAIFTLSANSCPMSPATLAAGSQCQVSVVFHPTATGTVTGTMTITSDAPSSPDSVSLSGTGKPACPLGSLQPTARVLRGADQTTFTVSPTSTCKATDQITLACVNAEPATCAFNPESIQNPQQSLLTMGNLKAVGGNAKQFEVTGTSADLIQRTLYLQVLFEDFRFLPYPQEATVGAGGTASYLLTVDPVNNLTGQVSLSCSGGPPGSGCTVTPGVVSLKNYTPVQAEVRVRTAGGGMAVPGIPNLPLSPGWRIALLMLALLLLGMAVPKIRQRRAQGRTFARPLRPAWVMLGAVLTLVLMWASCGGGGMAGLNTRGTYTIVVKGNFIRTSATTASSDPGAPPLSHDLSLKLTVR